MPKPTRLPGSSPLTRGKRPTRQSRKSRRGLIPAHAGKTSPHDAAAPQARAHPRSRGENIIQTMTRAWLMGSSPLTRGKPGPPGRKRRRAGLIPAHAGKTGCKPARAARPWAHPRSRGENEFLRRLNGRDMGSSPLTRGKPGSQHLRSRRPRLIPAHAGKTTNPTIEEIAAWAHPRSRGENIPRDPMVIHLLGSSPLTRGKPRPFEVMRRNVGLIPAHAGKTTFWRTRGFDGGAHPRSRGENRVYDMARAVAEGSSPLTRGKPLFFTFRFALVGLIPAHAGKTAM